MSLIFGPGQFLSPDPGGKHVIGGPNHWKGAECPNCRKPLMMHVQLDTSDPALACVKFPWRYIPLLYCCRCILYQYPFSYTIVSGDTIDIVECFRRPSMRNLKEWDEEVNISEIAKAQACLVAMPPRLQEIINWVNGRGTESDVLRKEFSTLASGFRQESRGPWIEPLNQVLGFGLLQQQDAISAGCEACMDRGELRSGYFIASLYNDSTHGLKFTFAAAELLFYLCPKCWTMNVSHLL